MYSVTKAAQMLKVHPNTIRNAIKTGKIYYDRIESLTGFTYTIKDLDLFLYWKAKKMGRTVHDLDRTELEWEYGQLTEDGSNEGAWAR